MIENTISIDGIDVENTATENTADETEMQNSTADVQTADTLKNAAEAAEETDVQTADNTAQQISETADQPPMVELNIYGEKVQLPMDQALAQAQKGFAFEHVKAQLAAAKNDARLKTLEAVAQQRGKSLSQLVLEMHSNMINDSLAAKYGSVNAAPIDEVAKAVAEIENCRRQLQHSETEMQKQHWRSQLVEFIEHNPRCKEIPDEVIAAAKQGENISAAYDRLYGDRLSKQLTEAQREIETLKSQHKAAASATPSAMGGGEKAPKQNEFLKIMQSTW